MSLLLIGAEALAAATVIPLTAGMLAAEAGRASLRHLARLGGFLALLLFLPFAALLPSCLTFSLGPPARFAPMSSPPAFHLIGWLLIGLMALWAAGTLVLLARWLGGIRALNALFRRSKPHPFDRAMLARWSEHAGLDGDWRLRLSAEIQIPISWGIIRSTVLLPEPCAGWTALERDGAMLHELAHLRRRDGLAQAIAMLACALYWPHPLVWRQARALRADAEEAADDAVLLSGVRPSDYAELLLRMAAKGTRPAAGPGFSMAEETGLAARIQSVLATKSSRSGVTRMQILKTSLLGASAALVLALGRPSFGAGLQPAALQAEPEPPPADALPSPVAQSDLPPPRDGSVSSPVGAASPNGPATLRHSRRRRGMIVPSPAGAKIGEAVAQAISQAHIGDIVAKAVNEAHIGQAVAKATSDTEIAEKVTAALAQAHIGEKVAEAMKPAQPAIDAAVARAERAALAAEQAAPAARPVPPQ